MVKRLIDVDKAAYAFRGHKEVSFAQKIADFSMPGCARAPGKRRQQSVTQSISGSVPKNPGSGVFAKTKSRNQIHDWVVSGSIKSLSLHM